MVPQDVINPKIMIQISITGSCINPHATIVLQDEKGNTLDEKSFTIETKVTTNPVPLVMAIVFIGITLVAVFMYRKKQKNNETTNQ